MGSCSRIIKQWLGRPLAIMVPVKAIAIFAFILTAILYFVIPHTCRIPFIGNVFVKCAPVLCLMWFVFLHMSTDNISGNCCSKRIFFGLLFSCIGDALLILDSMFIQGMASFALAQVFYISALGFDELKLGCGISVYTLCALITPSLLPSSDVFLRCSIPVYSFLLATMGWRSLAKLYHEGSTSWNRFLVGAGGVLWMVSDATLAYNEFNQAFPSANVIVMTTYYLGQFGIASSVMLENEVETTIVSKSRLVSS